MTNVTEDTTRSAWAWTQYRLVSGRTRTYKLKRTVRDTCRGGKCGFVSFVVVNSLYLSPQAFGFVRFATKISPHPRRREEPKHLRSPSRLKSDQRHY